MKHSEPRLPGHGLMLEGGPFTLQGSEIVQEYHTTTGLGHGKCNCGAVSKYAYDTGADRKRWHQDHKAEILELTK